MAAQSRQENLDVVSLTRPAFAEIVRRMRAEPFSFEFFQAVWLLERSQPEGARVGYFSDPSGCRIGRSASFSISSIIA